MGFPNGTYIAQILDAFTRAELEQFYSLLQGYLSTQHKSDGSHSAVTADSLAVTGAVTGGSTGVFNGNVTGDADGRAVAIGSVTVESNVGAGIDLHYNAASHWTVAAEQGIFSASPSITVSDLTNPNAAPSTLALYRSSAVGTIPAVYALVPTHSTVNLTIGENTSNRRVAEVNSLVYNGGETGTWTPVLSFGGASTGITYSTQSGTYSKFGNVVTVEMRLVLTSKGSSTGTVAIAGLPYTAAAFPSALIDFGAGGASLASTPYAAISGTSLFPLHISGGVRTQLTNANFTGTDDLRFGISYRV